MEYRLEDARTGALLLTIQVQPGEESERAARAEAGRQARRHAAGGGWVLVRGWDRYYLYVQDRYYQACARCGQWMLPVARRYGDACRSCRARPRLSTAVHHAQPRKRRPAPPDMQLRLPDTVPEPAELAGA